MRIEADDQTYQQLQSSLGSSDVMYHTYTLEKSPPAKKESNPPKLLPRFYHPLGKPKKFDAVEATRKINLAFDESGKEDLKLSEFGPVAKALGCPFYWRSAIFEASKNGGSCTVNRDDVISTWKRIGNHCHDDASRFVALLTKTRDAHLVFEDFQTLLQDIIETHPGLAFLRNAPAFHSRYMSTVIARIFYSVNRSWSGRISIQELKRSNFLQALKHIEADDDINTEISYFSYEHFYVIYCKFWELDTNHDLVIDATDLTRHEHGVISPKILQRVVSSAVSRWDASDYFYQKMSYVDFVWFLISEEDKKSPTSVEYWFRCMDLDGDGKISMYEMEYFYEEQMKRLKLLNIVPLPFQNCLCQIFDLIKPKHDNYITLGDLKKSKMADVFFDTFINVEKYLMNEKRDFLARGNKGSNLPTMSDWDVYAKEEYEYLVCEDEDEYI